MGCCCGKGGDFSEADTKRHPLLREFVANSTSSNQTSTSTTSDPLHLNGLETRAHFDALQGPPMLASMKDDLTRSPNVLRGSLKGTMKMEYFRLPENGFPIHVWFKIHLKDFIDHIRVFNSLIRPHCNRSTVMGGPHCKTMMGPPNIDFKWTCDKEGFFSDKINKSLSAASYIEKVLDTTKTLLKDHFRKTEIEMEEKTYEAAKTIVSLIFRVYCHVLYHHHDLFVESYTLPHLNSCFVWFILFSTESQLLEEEVECEPLQVLIADIVRSAHQADEEGVDVDDENLKMSCDDRLSSFLNSFASDDVSKLTASSFGTEKSLYSQMT